MGGGKERSRWMKGGQGRKRRGGVVSANMVWLSCEGTDGGGRQGEEGVNGRDQLTSILTKEEGRKGLYS